MYMPCLHYFTNTRLFNSFPSGTSGIEPAYQCRRHKRCKFDPCVGKIPWRRTWQHTPGFLPGKSLWTEEPRGEEVGAGAFGSWAGEVAPEVWQSPGTNWTGAGRRELCYSVHWPGVMTDLNPRNLENRQRTLKSSLLVCTTTEFFNRNSFPLWLHNDALEFHF